MTDKVMNAKNAGNYRVWHVANPPGSPIHRYVDNPERAAELINKWDEADLNSVWVWANACGLEVFEDGEWQEWYSEDGESITEVMDRTND